MLKWVAGPYQLCAGQVTGVEAAIHRVRSASLQKDSNVILLADKSNTFNSLNRVCTQFRHKEIKEIKMYVEIKRIAT